MLSIKCILETVKCLHKIAYEFGGSCEINVSFH